eukprot:12772297-Alexandrium_andersonii.AAC.1
MWQPLKAHCENVGRSCQHVFLGTLHAHRLCEDNAVLRVGHEVVDPRRDGCLGCLLFAHAPIVAHAHWTRVASLQPLGAISA